MKISPSLLSADFANLEKDIKDIESAEMLHLDVMDGHFVPNISFGIPVIKSIRNITDIFFDVHIMISEPQKYIDSLVDSGADLITFHLEADGDASETIRMIKARGIKAGISIKPNTPVEEVMPYINDVDLILVMTVEPGFGGQSFMADMMPKVRALREAIKNMENPPMLQVDGGVSQSTIAECAKNGADCFVAGSAVFKAEDREREIDTLRKIAKEAVNS